MTPIDPEEEADILECLEHDRHMFAWTLTRCGERAPDLATQEALSFYSYKPPADPERELMELQMVMLRFHGSPWHQAMLHIHGDGYWWSDPTLGGASAEYETESAAFRARRRSACGAG